MPKTQIERMWLFGAGIVALLLLLIGYLMFISPQNSKTSSAQSQVAAAKAVNQSLQAHIAGLRAQSQNLPKYEADLKVAELALPTTSGLPDFLRTLQSIGGATLTTLSSLTVGPPTDVTTIAGAAPAPVAKSTSSSGSAVSSSGATGLGGLKVYALPITAQVSGTISALDAFLTQLQIAQPRAVLISQLAESSGADPTAASTRPTGTTSLQLTMQAFVAPISAAEQAQLSAASGK